MYSCTEDGNSTGMPQALRIWSLWWAVEEDLAAWSSPANTSTPPCLAEPALLACLKTSPQRSTPGPLPYHMENTPSYLASLNRLVCCVPQTAVAARSSFIPGWNLTWWASRCFLAFIDVMSIEVTGEPR